MPNNESLSSIDTKDEFGTNYKDRGGREHDVLDAVAGPSNVSAVVTKLKRKRKSSGTATPVPPDEQKSPAFAEPPSFENNGDFIAFGSEEEEPDLHREDKEELRDRETDKGKGKARERDDGGGRKRNADLDRNDGYDNKKRRIEAASRKAPWVADVDWEGSTNVAELYAFLFLFRYVEADDTPQITQRSRCICEIHLPDARGG
jgi:non-canonical poly(A) RNA polymerase PAPD5/7